MEKDLKVAYEPHPVSPERKAELRAQGYRIVDIQFAPADWVERSIESTDDGFPDDETMRTAIKEATGKAPHHNAKRATLIEQYKAIE